MIYKVELKKSAQKELNKLPKQTQIRLMRAILGLAPNPRRGNVRPMVGKTAWRLLVGEYRVIYDIKDKKLTVLVLKIGARKDVYRK